MYSAFRSVSIAVLTVLFVAVASRASGQHLLIHAMAQAQKAASKGHQVQPHSRKDSLAGKSQPAVPAVPAVSSITPTNFSQGDTVTVTGTNLSDVSQVSFDGIAGTSLNNLSSTSVSAIVAGPVSSRTVAITAPGGTAVYTPPATTQGTADFTFPNLGQNITIIPTPTFIYTNTANQGRFGFSATAWGNALGTDSTLKKVASNLLVPQISPFGIKVECAALWKTGSFARIGVDGEVNLLVKKVSYYDTSEKKTTSFNPFAFHPRLGITGTFVNDLFFVSAYGNLLSILNNNDQFSALFNTHGKSTFIYPEIDGGVIVNFSSGKQLLKLECDMLINSGDVQTLYGTGDKIVPYLKAGFVTKL